MKDKKQQDLFDTTGLMSGAIFSECKKYRFALWRNWDEKLPMVMFIGLNPSTADAFENDRTISTVMRYAKGWGFGGLYMMNLFSYVTKNPSELLTCTDPVKGNDTYLRAFSPQCETIIMAYGNFKIATDRAKQVCSMFPDAKAMFINKNGTPHHPLYLKKNIVPVAFNPK